MEIINLTTFKTIPDENQEEFNGQPCMFVHSRDEHGNPLVWETRKYQTVKEPEEFLNEAETTEAPAPQLDELPPLYEDQPTQD